MAATPIKRKSGGRRRVRMTAAQKQARSERMAKRSARSTRRSERAASKGKAERAERLKAKAAKQKARSERMAKRAEQMERRGSEASKRRGRKSSSDSKDRVMYRGGSKRSNDYYLGKRKSLGGKPKTTRRSRPTKKSSFDRPKRSLTQRRSAPGSRPSRRTPKRTMRRGMRRRMRR